MKKIFVLILVFIVSGALLYRCEEIETGFDALTGDFDPSVQAGLVFANGNMIYEVENNVETDVTIPIKLRVWGPLQSAATTVTITVDAVNSTAQSPTHYNLATTTVTIPADKGGAQFNLVMHSANFAKGDTVLLVMNMTASGFNTELYASEAKLRLSKKPECPFDIKTFTGSYIANERGYGEYNVQFTADPVNPNRIWQTNFWDYTDDLLAFDLDPLTGVVTVPSQIIIMGGDEYEVVGSGTFDPCLGTLVVDFQGDVDGTHEEYRPGSVKSAKGGKGK